MPDANYYQGLADQSPNWIPQNKANNRPWSEYWVQNPNYNPEGGDRNYFAPLTADTPYAESALDPSNMSAGGAQAIYSAGLGDRGDLPETAFNPVGYRWQNDAPDSPLHAFGSLAPAWFKSGGGTDQMWQTTPLSQLLQLNDIVNPQTNESPLKSAATIASLPGISNVLTGGLSSVLGVPSWLLGGALTLGNKLMSGMGNAPVSIPDNVKNSLSQYAPKVAVPATTTPAPTAGSSTGTTGQSAQDNQNKVNRILWKYMAMGRDPMNDTNAQAEIQAALKGA